MNVKLNKISKDLMEAVKGSADKGTEPYDTSATVVRVDGDTAWVHIDGGVDETPIKKTIDCKSGDNVQIRVGGGDAWITGNETAPPTDDTRVIEVEKETQKVAKGVSEIGKIANNTNQYFWHTESGTDTGAHITEVTREKFLQNPNNSGGNLLARSNGIAVRDGLDELATFGADGTQIGDEDSGHTIMTDRAFILKYGSDNIARLYVSNNESGLVLDATYNSGGEDGNTITMDIHAVSITSVKYDDNTAISNYTLSSDGYTVTVPSRDTSKRVIIDCVSDSPFPHYLFGTYWTGETLGRYSFHQGRKNGAGQFASAMGYGNRARGVSSHAEGESNLITVDGIRSHAEGYNNTISSNDAHAEGDSNTVSGNNAHAEGYGNTVSGQNAHAEGSNNVASGDVSHAGGYKTIAQGDTQTVIGHWNVAQGTSNSWASTDYAFIIGNGSAENSRSNAFAVSWEGMVYPAKSLRVNNTHGVSGIDTNSTARNLVSINSSNTVLVGDTNVATNLRGSTVSINGNTLADYVIDEDTSTTTTGVWHWRKWKSGRAEAWGRWTETSAASTSDGGGYRTSGVTPSNFPTGLFSSTPHVQCSLYAGGVVITPVCLTNPSSTSAGKWAGYRVSTNSNTGTKTYDFYCVSV